MIFAIFTDPHGHTIGNFYDRYEQYFRDTFSPLCEELLLIDLDRIKGKTYADKKAFVQDKAIDYSLSIGQCENDLSYGEWNILNNFFEKYGRRYGLLTEFRENAIC